MKPILKSSLIAANAIALSGLILHSQPVAQAAPQRVQPQKAQPKVAASKGVKWESSWGAAVKAARSSGKPLFVDFYATWCGPCKILDKHVYTDRRFIAASRKWVMPKVDAERNTKLAGTYRVTAFPTLIFYTPKAQAIMRKEGFEIPEKYQTSEKAAIGEITRQMVRALHTAHDKALKRQPIAAKHAR